MPYSDIGISGNQITELKKALKATAWRIKVMKPTGKKLPDVDTTKVVKIDKTGGTYPAPDTAIGDYRKCIHDDKQNRTFILHRRLPNDTDAVVSVINHSFDTTDPDYIETIKQSVCDAVTPGIWTTDYDQFYVQDMAFNPNTQKLALSFYGAQTPDVPLCLMVVDCNRKIDELATNYCSTLADNPNYLGVEAWIPDADYTGDTRSQILYVRHWNNRFYCYSLCYFTGATPADFFNQLGYFDTAGNYHHVFTCGMSPWYQINTSDGGTTYNDSIGWPISNPRYSEMEFESGSLYWGDPLQIFDARSNGNYTSGITSFEINDSGILTMGRTPSRDIDNGFGCEPTVAKIDLASTAAPTVIQQTITVAPTYNPGSGMWELPAGVAIASFDLSACPGQIAVKCVENHVDGAFGTHGRLSKLLVQTQYGTAIDEGVNTATYGGAYLHTFCYQETARVGVQYPGTLSQATEFYLKFEITISYPFPSQLVDVVGPHTPGITFKQASDTTVMQTGTYSLLSTDWELADLQYPSGDALWCRIGDCYYDSAWSKYIIAMLDQDGNGSGFETGGGLGLWCLFDNNDDYQLTKYTSAGSDLEDDHIGRLLYLGDGAVGILCDDSVNGALLLSTLSVQFFNTLTETFSDAVFTPGSLAYTQVYTTGLWYDSARSMVGWMTGSRSSNRGEIWFYGPETITDEEWDRNPRMWWDGSEPDVIMGADSNIYADAMNSPASFSDPSFSDNKGLASHEFSFGVSGWEYLPGADSAFNRNPDFPDSIDGTLKDGARVILEAGVFSDFSWTWIPEVYGFVIKAPANTAAGVTDMQVTTVGSIGMFLTFATYKGTHTPDQSTYTAVELTSPSADGLTYSYDDGGGVISDWVLNPEPIIYIDGVVTQAYDMSSDAGTITFKEDRSGNTVTATFNAYDTGTNEAEDIIICILQYPQELGGPGLDDSYITDLITGETLTTDDNLTYSFSRNNIKSDAAENTIYVDGTPTGSVTWDFRNGTAIFSGSQAGHVITGDCRYYTIQKSGVTLKPIDFDPRKQKSAWDATQEVCRRVAPNYIIRERRDGRIEADFYTQKIAGNEDFTISSSDIVIESISADPAFEGLATRVLSFGQAELQDLPNLCLGKTVTDLWTTEASSRGWTHGWNSGDIQSITDGEPGSGMLTGYGGWGDGTSQVQTDLIAAGTDGIPVCSVDMEAAYEIATIIIARPSQAAGEGERGASVQFSIWGSLDSSDWTKLAAAFILGPGQNTQIKVGTNWQEGSKFQYIRVNCHSLGLYTGPDNDTDSQMGLSEIQAYENEIIQGEAVLQNTDPSAAHYDSWGLLDRYGIRTFIARDGSPDPALTTQAQCDADAGFVLDEVVRLVSQIQVTAPWLPAVPKFSTIKVANPATGEDATFFVESRSGGGDGTETQYIYAGSTLP